MTTTFIFSLTLSYFEQRILRKNNGVVYSKTSYSIQSPVSPMKVIEEGFDTNGSGYDNFWRVTGWPDENTWFIFNFYDRTGDTIADVFDIWCKFPRHELIYLYRDKELGDEGDGQAIVITPVDGEFSFVYYDYGWDGNIDVMGKMIDDQLTEARILLVY